VRLERRRLEDAGRRPGRTWYLRNSNSGGVANVSFGYGRDTDFPICGDWNGDGIDTPGVVRGNVWYLRNSNTGGAANISFGYGHATDYPIVGDWNGDGITTPGVMRGNTWYLRNSKPAGWRTSASGTGAPPTSPSSATGTATRWRRSVSCEAGRGTCATPTLVGTRTSRSPTG
jgi:hypothetical protein